MTQFERDLRECIAAAVREAMRETNTLLKQVLDELKKASAPVVLSGEA